MQAGAVFRPHNTHLLCIDSDGCAVDSMNIKHIFCFGPCLIEEWKLQGHAEDILKEWNEINLYSRTRGVNRFIGLGMELSEVNKKYQAIPGINEYLKWTRTTEELSNASVGKAFQESGNEIFRKALHWSETVNSRIQQLPKDKITPFKNVREALEKASHSADVVIVSSANEAAVLEEWKRFGLLPYVDLCMTQKDGPKAHCISKLLGYGYPTENVLMIGDAPGDFEAARKNGVLFFPIMTGKEEDSWKEFSEQILPAFLSGRYAGDFEEKQIQEFFQNLNGK
jgi:phosphoglycolate phosphatase-like HAD superfamily hydrolase